MVRPTPGFARIRTLGSRWLCRCGLVAALLGIVSLLVTGSSAVAATGGQGLSASVAGGASFPNRALVLTVPGSPALGPRNVHVTENGGGVQHLRLNSLRDASQGDFGVILLIDTDPTMIGPPLKEAVAAARRLAALRTGNQQLGIMFGDRITLPLTTDPTRIQQALANVPRHVGYTDLLRDATSAVAQLKAAKIAAGSVIYVTDDIDRDPTYTPQSVGRFATASHVRIFVVGIHDRAFTHRTPNDLPPSAMQELATAGGGQFTEASKPAQLTQIFTAIDSGLRSKYLVRYHSLQLPGQNVTVDLRVDGIPGIVTTSYSAPGLAASPGRRAPAHTTPFWRSSLAIVVVALVAAMLLGLAIGLLVKHYAGSGNLRGRVGEFIPTPPAEPRGGGPAVPGLDSLGVPASALERSWWWARFAEDVDIGRLGIPAKGLVQLTALGAIVLAVILTLATGTVLAGLGALLIAPFVLRAVVNFNVRRQRALFSTQLPSHLEEVAGAMRSGRSLVEALGVVADGADEPTRSEFDRALADERMGQPLEETLRPISARMKSPDVDQLAVIAALHRGSGANVAEVLEHVAEAARQRDDMRRELRVMTAQARMTRWILTALPVAMLLILAVLRPDYERPLFHTSGGHFFIIGAVVLVLLGSFMMSRIVDIEA